MTERITITPRRVDAQEGASIVSLVQLGRTGEAWERFQVASVGDGALARLGGAINAALAAQPAPSVVSLPDWGADEQGNRRVRMAPGYVYAVRFAVPATTSDAGPRVRVSAGIVPAGAGDIRAAIVGDLAQVPAEFGGSTAGGAATVYGDWPADAGRTLYALYALGPDQPASDVHVLVSIPRAA